MTFKTNARLAGVMFLIYTATSVAQGVLLGPAIGGANVAAKLASISQHVTSMRLVVVLSMVTILDALFLAVALYAITREEERDLALLALCCRLTEGVINIFPTLAWTGLLWLGTEIRTPAAEATTAAAIGGLLLKVPRWSTSVSATCFGVGSTLFSYLFLQARSIPAPLAWLGIFSSILVVVGAPLEFVGFIKARWFLWMPILPFELALAFWLLTKAAPNQAIQRTAPRSDV